MKAFYNEHDPGAAAWLRELIAEGLIAPGVVDERDIRNIRPDELKEFRQVHLFAGVGGWSYALRLAGVGDDMPWWTGSCPCQPYSSAGKRKGDADPRNLWPEMFRLVRECRPHVVFGEQVEGAVRHGWLDGVSADLEGEGYAVGAAVLGAHSVGAPHIRQRLYWVADAGGGELRGGGRGPAGTAAGGVRGPSREQRVRSDAGAGGNPLPVGLADTPRRGLRSGGGDEPDQREGSEHGRRVGHSEGEGRARGEHAGTPEEEEGGRSRLLGTGGSGSARGLADADGRQPGDGEIQSGGEHGQQPEDGRAVRVDDTASERCERNGTGRQLVLAKPSGQGIASGGSGSPGFWSDFDIIPCRDEKNRRVPPRRTQPGLFPLAHGLPGRVGLLRGAGNAICPWTAAAFIRAYREITA